MRRVAIAIVALAGVARADDRHGLAVGAELGEPTSATVGWLTPALVLDAAIGSGTLYGPGLSAHADVEAVATRLAEQAVLRVGLGVRYYDQHYKLASMDELPSTNYGVRVPVALAYDVGAIQIYLEAAPGYDFKRTQSCTLADGPNSICPHAQATHLFLDVVVGARWYLSH